MATNRRARQDLISIYGKECFIEKLHLREGRILYTGTKKTEEMQKITYHHIKMKKDKGESTAENGALIGCGNHTWFHQQSEDKQEEMNQAFMDYKECNIVFVDDLYPRVDYKVIANHFSLRDLKLDQKIHNKNKQKQELSKITRDYIDR